MYKAVKNFSANGITKKAGDLINDKDAEIIGKFLDELIFKGQIIKASEKDLKVLHKKKELNLNEMDKRQLEVAAISSQAIDEMKAYKMSADDLKKKIVEKLIPKKKAVEKIVEKVTKKKKVNKE